MEVYSDAEASQENFEVLPRVLMDEEKLLAAHEYRRGLGEIPETVLVEGYDLLVTYLQGTCIR